MALAEFDEALISKVREYPCLYNNKSPDFKVVWKKENAWVEISRQLKSDGTLLYYYYMHRKVKYLLLCELLVDLSIKYANVLYVKIMNIFMHIHF